jgi:hypothetical protein
MAIYIENQTAEQRKEEFRLFLLAAPEFYNIPENRAIIEQYLDENNLPFLKDTWAAGFILNRNKLVKKPNKPRLDDANLPGRSGAMTAAEKREEEQKAEQAREDRKSSINKATRQRERREAETRIGQHQEYTNGKVNHARTETARQRMLVELDRTNPREASAASSL